MHIFIPSGAKYDYEQARQFSYLICTLINTQLPNITSIERAPSKRSGKVYLDFLQNSQGKTMAAPYSLRPLANAPVSTPLIWDEVKPGLRPEQFTINSILQRLDHYGDLWQPVLGPGIDMKYYLGKLGVLLKIA
jgi:bifunctional non-homologous end joining protein LigD